MAGRPATVRNHAELIEYLMSIGCGIDADFDSLPEWLSDVFQGACGQMPGNTRLNPAKLWRTFLTLTEVSTKTVLDSLNRKRTALGDAPVKQRYAEYYAAALRCAGDAIAYHRRNGKADYRGIPVLAPMSTKQCVEAAVATIRSAYKLTADGEVVRKRDEAATPLNAPVMIHGKRYNIDFVISALIK